jgi:DTW domain-containing protein
VPRYARRAVYTDVCELCHRPRVACVCDRIVSYPTERRVLVLQHPQERDVVLGSAQILAASLPKASLVVGLSWRNLAHALGEEVDERRWAVLFPERDGAESANRKVQPASLEGLVVLDGTWSKAKTLLFRNPWLHRLGRLTLSPSKPSIYGRLRAEPRRELVSTLESVASALTLCGEPPEIQAGLERVFRTLVQRVRDANLVPTTARRSRQRRRNPPAGPAAPATK